MQVVRLKFDKKFIKLIKITNCVCLCGRMCDVAVVCAECVHTQLADISGTKEGKIES